MDFNEIVKEKMKPIYAKEIAGWKYENEYQVYNMPSYEEMVLNNFSITKKEEAKNYIVYLLDNKVVAYSKIKVMHDNYLYFGIGLAPELCGKKLGGYFIEDSINEFKVKYPDKAFYLEVRSNNNRAIKAYEKIGFIQTNKIVKKDRLNNDTEFVEMLLR